MEFGFFNLETFLTPPQIIHFLPITFFSAFATSRHYQVVQGLGEAWKGLACSCLPRLHFSVLTWFHISAPFHLQLTSDNSYQATGVVYCSLWPDLMLPPGCATSLPSGLFPALVDWCVEEVRYGNIIVWGKGVREDDLRPAPW